MSMGTEISEEDLKHIVALCDQVIEISEYREQLHEYLKNRMQAIAPNLSLMVGELVGARLIAHAGSLMNLAKYPASTVQILGAEKALFRALKTKHQTPKYGLIYHASLVGQTAPKFKGKISRVLAAKSALAIRVDALAENADSSIGLEGRAKVEARMKFLEEGKIRSISRVGSNVKSPYQSYDSSRSSQTPSQVRTAQVYNPVTDTTISGKTESPAKEEKKKGKKRKREKTETQTESATPAIAGGTPEGKSKKEKKKKKKSKSSQ